MTAVPIPYLSIVYAGRNDDRPDEFTKRFSCALRFNHERLAAAAVNYEVLFVEWRPVADKPLIADLLRGEVPHISDRLTTIVVDARYHDAFSQNPGIEFHESVARNVAIRRASGSYILCANPNVYFSREAVALFAQRILRPMALYLATRVDLKSDLDLSALDDTVLRDIRNHERTTTVQPPALTNGSGEFLLLDRFSWHALRGFNEVYRVRNLRIEASFCHRAHASGILVKDSAANVYRVVQGTSSVSESPYGSERKQVESVAWSSKSMLYENPTTWGLGAAPAFQQSRNDFRIEFDENAVPALVSLRGITVQQR